MIERNELAKLLRETFERSMRDNGITRHKLIETIRAELESWPVVADTAIAALQPAPLVGDAIIILDALDMVAELHRDVVNNLDKIGKTDASRYANEILNENRECADRYRSSISSREALVKVAEFLEGPFFADVILRTNYAAKLRAAIGERGKVE